MGKIVSRTLVTLSYSPDYYGKHTEYAYGNAERTVSVNKGKDELGFKFYLDRAIERQLHDSPRNYKIVSSSPVQMAG